MVLPIRQFFLGLARRGSGQIGLSRGCKPQVDRGISLLRAAFPPPTSTQRRAGGPSEGLLRPRVARAQKIISFHPLLCSASGRMTRPPLGEGRRGSAQDSDASESVIEPAQLMAYPVTAYDPMPASSTCH